VSNSGVDFHHLSEIVKGAEIVINQNPSKDLFDGFFLLQVSDPGSFVGMIRKILQQEFPDRWTEKAIADSLVFQFAADQSANFVFGMSGNYFIAARNEEAFAEARARLQDQQIGLRAPSNYKIADTSQPSAVRFYLDANTLFERGYGSIRPMLVFGAALVPNLADFIDPNALPRRRTGSGQCVPVFPHDAIRTNTIFEVVKGRGGRTAWADKHPAYDLVNGPSGTGVDDLYTPEITNVNGFDATVSVDCTVANDQLKVSAIINEIHGLKHDGSPGAGVPTVFGMNFQAVSVGQKVASDNGNGTCPQSTHTGKPGGYLDGAGTPTEVLAFGLQKTDEALGDMIQALKQRGIYDSTLFIVSAKHGQSPINPVKVNKPGHFADLVATLPDAATNPAAQAMISAANCSSGACGFVQDDDIALIWLQDQSNTKAVVDYLNTNAKALFIDDVLGGEEIELKFNDPARDSRTPDVIVQPIYGTIYTGSKAKNAEHGGMSFGDVNVGLVVSNPRLPSSTIKTQVLTSQVAPTILQALDIEPDALKSVVVEHTPVLPGLFDRRD